MKNMKRLAAGLLLLFVGENVMAQNEIIDLSKKKNNDIFVVNDFKGKPDKEGLLKQYTLKLPPYEKGLIYINHDFKWRSGNEYFAQMFSPEAPIKGNAKKDYSKGQGQLFILKLKNGNYFTLLPIAGPDSMSWLVVNAKGEIILKHGTLGTAEFNGNMNIYAVAEAVTPWQSIYSAWRKGLSLLPEKTRSRFREKKKYPEVFKYLGWCTWNAYQRNVDEKKMVNDIKSMKKLGVPIRSVLIDGGALVL